MTYEVGTAATDPWGRYRPPAAALLHRTLPGVVYEPPYCNPAEDEFVLNLARYGGPVQAFEVQAPIKTVCGRFVVGFIVRNEGRSVGFECGTGRRDNQRDACRDAVILGSGAVDAIYRFWDFEPFLPMEDQLYVVSRHEPQLFSERGLNDLEALASRAARTARLDAMRGQVTLTYPREHVGDRRRVVVIQRQGRFPGERGRSAWYEFYRHAVLHGGGDLTRLMQTFHR